jgi:four helix bundle protein
MYTTFKEMPVWQDAINLSVTLFNLSEHLPRKEDYGFTSQIRRSALSIPANIAEAFGRNHTLDKVNFYYMARGSLTETQSHLEYGKKVGYILPEKADKIDAELCKLYNDINKIILSLKADKRTDKKNR